MASVLVTCPTARVKDYALGEYLAAYESFNWDNKSLLMVDTTNDDGEYAHRLKLRGVMIGRLPNRSPHNVVPQLITEVWEKVIIPYAWDYNFDWVFHIESDIICPPDTITATVNFAELHDAALVSHSYPVRPARDPVDMWDASIGCTMWHRDVFKPGHSFHNYAEYNVRAHAYRMGYRVVQLTNFLDIKHLSEEIPLPPEAERTGQVISTESVHYDGT